MLFTIINLIQTFIVVLFAPMFIITIYYIIKYRRDISVIIPYGIVLIITTGLIATTILQNNMIVLGIIFILSVPILISFTIFVKYTITLEGATTHDQQTQ